MDKVLLVTDVPPNKQYSGSLLTWHLCKNFSARTLAGYFIVNPDIKAKVEFPFPEPHPSYMLTEKETERAFRPFERAFRQLTWARRLDFLPSLAREFYRKYVEIPRHARKLLRFAKEQQAQKIWIILQGQTMIWLAEHLIKKNQLPIHAQVWDVPSWWARAHQLDRFSKKLLLRSYDFCIRACTEFGSASYNMSTLIKEKHGKESVPLLGINPTPSDGDISTIRHERDKFIVGLAGQTYASETVWGLVAALDSVYWEIEGKPVEIHYWGYSDTPKDRSRILRMGYIKQEDLVRALNNCDVLYCPYWFYTEFSEESKTSFPGKLSTYLNAGRPMLFHGPEYSSPIPLLRKHNAGICCCSTDPEAILFALRKALFSPEIPTIVQNALALARGELHEMSTHARFRKFMRMQSGDENAERRSH